VKDALKDVGVQGMTVTESRGFGRQSGHMEVYRGAEYVIEFIPKVRIEVLVSEDHVEPAVKAIIEAAQTGTIGDGKIWVTDAEGVYRVRTGEIGEDAI
jgi:nitrogen regulatory protein P-II 1